MRASVSRLKFCLPFSIRFTADENESACRVPAFEYLIRLYEREGFLAEALDIARRAVACGQGEKDFDRLTKRSQELNSENG